MSQDHLTEEIMVLFFGGSAVGFLIVAVVNFYRSSNDP
jgi:hypothetical protein